MNGQIPSIFPAISGVGCCHDVDSHPASGHFTVWCRIRAGAFHACLWFTRSKKAPGRTIAPDGLPGSIFQQPIFGGRHPVDGFENARKVEGVIVTERGGDFLHAHHRLVQKTAGVPHAQANEAVNGRAAGLPFEQREEMGGGNIGLCGERGHLQRLVQVPHHVGNALFYLPHRFRLASPRLMPGKIPGGCLRGFNFDAFHWYSR